MAIPTLDSGNSVERSRAEGEAAAAVRDGRLVILPTETVYGVAASAISPSALDTLWRVSGAAERSALAWHAPDPISLTEVLGVTRPQHRHLISKLAPGPVTFEVLMDEAARARARDQLGIPPGVLDTARGILARVPAPAVTRAVLARLWEERLPVVMIGAGTEIPGGSGKRGPAGARDVEEAARWLERAGMSSEVALAVKGPRARGARSTLVALGPSDRYEVVREGGLEARFIDRAAQRIILFVCSGNTCRSPMAAAIARHLLAGRAGESFTIIKSAGTSASSGSPVTDESVESLRKLGINLGPHRSTPLTRELIAEADAIFTMTSAHLASVNRLDPESAGKAELLDPGGDIPDPIGGPQHLYDETALRLRDAVGSRLDEILRKDEDE
ncbi:MAG TPA: Sua5/YciO/YrdC/YwlC family protein [Phycisphaerales bacterium]|nr:Sua5/YciO/YrdC/YwlC family protein [Phycisphaerales bacterium]